MINRREFIYAGSILGLGFLFVNPLSANSDNINAYQRPARVKRYLHGNPKGGCSTPGYAPDDICGIGHAEAAFEEYAYLTPQNHGIHC